MDYYKIGQKIRKYRKAMNMSQEKLSELVGISVTHMSHIETGNTRLSLPVLVDLAKVLEVRMDDLLFDFPLEKEISIKELSEILETCTPQEIKIITETVKALKTSFNKYLSK
ncbi:MAG: helix-turn-helix transcriptional regulator [Clostridia bacterium]|nr:helix-turn-helix transcriptional regulator [Clostridia bacterium]